MQHAIDVLLCGMKAGAVKDVFSRGSVHTIYGYECVYLGPSPDRMAYFWLAPHDVRGLNVEQLAEHGLELRSAIGARILEGA